MNLRKITALLLAMMMLFSFASCGDKKDDANQGDTGNQGTTVTEGSVKTGLAVVTDLTSSKEATDENGLAQADIILVGVTVDENGVIDDCAIDMVQGKIEFDKAGQIVTDINTEFQTKNELGANYGMSKASSIGKDWFEQAQALADYVTGKTLAEVKGIKVENGKAADADLKAGVTMTVIGYLSAIEEAVNNAKDLGAKKGDVINIESVTSIAKSTSATADKDATAQVYTTVGAVTVNGETITSAVIDAVQANVNISKDGKITSDIKGEVKTKNQLGTGYGMNKASSIGKDWFEQAETFAKYITGKTVSDVAGIAVDEGGKTTDADLKAGVTISVGDFKAVVGKIN